MMKNDLSKQISAITSALSSVRMPAMPGEYDIHGAISQALHAAGIEHIHEYRLLPRCRIDFLSGRIGIEVKKGRPSPQALRQQLNRYLASDALDAIIVVMQRAIELPSSIGGKPVILISLNRLWGVALP